MNSITAALHPASAGARRRPAPAGIYVEFYDPDGTRYGLPTYPYRWAPKGLATIRQLRARGLRPGGQQPAAQILWRKRQARRLPVPRRPRPAQAARPPRPSSPRSPPRCAPAAPAPPAGRKSPTASRCQPAGATTARAG